MKFDINQIALSSDQFVRYFLVAVLTVSFMLAYLVHISAVENSRKKDFSEYTVKLARLYAQIIDSQLEDKAQTEKNITFLLDSNTDLKDIYIVNKFAGVVAPISKAYDVVKDAELDELLLMDEKPSLLSSATSDSMYVPLYKNDKSLKAVVVMTFSKTSEFAVKNQLGYFIFLYILIFGVIIFLSRYTNELLEKPWLQLANDVDASIDGSGDSIEPPSHDDSSVMAKHQFLYFRLLSKLNSMSAVK